MVEGQSGVVGVISEAMQHAQKIIPRKLPRCSRRPGMTAYVMIDMKGERPSRRGEAVLMRVDNDAAVTWVRRCCGGGKKQARVGALLRIMRALEARGGCAGGG